MARTIRAEKTETAAFELNRRGLASCKRVKGAESPTYTVAGYAITNVGANAWTLQDPQGNTVAVPEGMGDVETGTFRTSDQANLVVTRLVTADPAASFTYKV